MTPEVWNQPHLCCVEHSGERQAERSLLSNRFPRFPTVDLRVRVISDNWWPGTRTHQGLSERSPGGRPSGTAWAVLQASWVYKMDVSTAHSQRHWGILLWGSLPWGIKDRLPFAVSLHLNSGSRVTARRWMKTCKRQVIQTATQASLVLDSKA